MANSVRDQPQFSGALKPGDLLHVIDSGAVDPQDRNLPLGAGQVVAMRHEAGAPTSGDDETTGAWVGLFWLDTTGPELLVCTDATESAAVWRTVADWS